MSKILISFIGTGAYTEKSQSTRVYRTATYTYDQKEVGTSSFVASVLYDYLKVDHLILIGTTRSMWEEVYRHFTEQLNQPFDEGYYWYLAEETAKANFQTPTDYLNLKPLERVLGSYSKAKIIPYGLTQTEQWNIFNVLADLFKSIGTKDRVSLDVTHAFRSLPMFSMTSFMYLNDVVGTTISLEGIYYGMLETQREFDGKAPIVDLSLIIKIQQWIKGAHSFLNFGKGYLLADLMQTTEQANILKDFSDVLSMNYLTAIDEKIKDFKALAENIEEPIAKMILPKILLDFTQRLIAAKSHTEFQLQLSIWHREKKNYATAYLVYIESLTTYACEINGWDWKSYTDRIRANQFLRNSPNSSKLKQLHKRPNFVRNNIVHSQAESLGTLDVIKTELTFYQTTFLEFINNHTDVN